MNISGNRMKLINCALYFALLWGFVDLHSVNADGAAVGFYVRRDDPIVSSPPAFPVLGQPVDHNNSLHGDLSETMETYPDLNSCLFNQKDSERLDLGFFDWESFRSPEAVRLCVFFVASALGNVEQMESWLASQGFAVYRMDGEDSIVVVPGDEDGSQNNHALIATYEGMERVVGEGFWRFVFRKTVLNLRPWRLFDHSSGVNLRYSDDFRVVDVNLNFGGK